MNDIIHITIQLDDGTTLFWDLNQGLDELVYLGARIAKQAETMKGNVLATAMSAQKPMEEQK